MKCAPYIKNLCNSLHSWREGGSLPGSPVKLAVVVPSPTRSEGGTSEPSSSGNPDSKLCPVTTAGAGGGNSDAVGHTDFGEDDDEILSTERSADGSVLAVRMSQGGTTTSNLATSHGLMVSTTSKEGEVVTQIVQPAQSNAGSSMKSDLIQALKKIRPESPDVTRAAKRFELAKQQGAIAKKLSLSPR